MGRVDIAIIGTGPAGLEAAITAKVRNKSILLFGSKSLSTKVEKAHAIDNYLGLPHVSGEAMQKAFADHAAAMGVEITEDRINAVYSMGDYFALQGGDNAMYEADAVILATGVVPGKLLPGEEQFLGRGVSYCATCDAALYRKKTTAVIGYSPKEEEEVLFLAEVADKVLYFPVYKDEVKLPETIEVIRETPVAIEKAEGGLKAVVTKEGRYEVNGVFVLRDAISPGQLVPGLETDGSHVVVNRSMATNIAGCFACGDIAGLPYQYIKSAGEGNVAALSAVSFIDQRRRAAKA